MKFISKNNKLFIERFFKIALSLWIIYHLVVITVIPNGTSLLGRILEKYIVSYASSLGMNTSWNFFSPDPAHTMYLKYTYYFLNDSHEEIKEPQTNYIPKTIADGAFDLKDRRFLYAMRYLVLEPNRLQVVLAPWLCKQNPEATHVRIEHIIDSIPYIDEAVSKKNSNVSDLGRVYDFVQKSIRCKDGQDEMGL